MKKEEKEGYIIASIIVLLFAFFIAYSIYKALAPSISNPTKTFYLASNLFPLKAYGYIGGIRFPQYAFYGTPQPNGTECISSVAVYSFNYTIQRFSSIPEIITNPKGVADAYYTSEGYLNVNIPNGYTLLCPDIINASKVI